MELERIQNQINGKIEFRYMKGGRPQVQTRLRFCRTLFDSQSEKYIPLEEKKDATKDVLYLRDHSAVTQYGSERLCPTGRPDTTSGSGSD